MGEVALLMPDAMALPETLIAMVFAGLLMNVLAQNHNLGWKARILPIIVLQVLLALFYNNDLALIWVYQYGYADTLPYGRLWFLLNPYWYTSFYLWIMLAYQLAGVTVLTLMWRRGKVSLSYVFLTQLCNLWLVLIHNPQSLEVMFFIYLIPLSRWLLVPAVLSKLPVGWSWNLSDGHWACFTGRINYVIGPYKAACGHFLFSVQAWQADPVLAYAFINYAFLGIVSYHVLRYKK